MFYGDTVNDTRRLFFSSWHTYRQNQPLTPLEQQKEEVILVHPEYHALLDTNPESSDQAYFPELGQTNPFLHMGLHLAIRDQVSTNRPVGIVDEYNRLLKKYNDPLIVEHMLMDPLVECLWQAQRQQSLPDDAAYLHALTNLS